MQVFRDRQAEAWDHFNVYLTQGDEHLKELESLVLRIASPKGNRVAGKFMGSSDLMRVFRRRIAGFENEFLGHDRWYAIRISKSVIPRL